MPCSCNTNILTQLLGQFGRIMLSMLISLFTSIMFCRTFLIFLVTKCFLRTLIPLLLNLPKVDQILLPKVQFLSKTLSNTLLILLNFRAELKTLQLSLLGFLRNGFLMVKPYTLTLWNMMDNFLITLLIGKPSLVITGLLLLLIKILIFSLPVPFQTISLLICILVTPL